MKITGVSIHDIDINNLTSDEEFSYYEKKAIRLRRMREASQARRDADQGESAATLAFDPLEFPVELPLHLDEPLLTCTLDNGATRDFYLSDILKFNKGELYDGIDASYEESFLYIFIYNSEFQTGGVVVYDVAQDSLRAYGNSKDYVTHAVKYIPDQVTFLAYGCSGQGPEGDVFKILAADKHGLNAMAEPIAEHPELNYEGFVCTTGRDDAGRQIHLCYDSHSHIVLVDLPTRQTAYNFDQLVENAQYVRVK